MKEKRYLTPELADQIAGVVEQFADGKLNIASDGLLEKLKEMLPVEKMNRDTMHQRLEGYYHASDILFTKVIEITGMERPEIVSKANLRPLSYYHYLTGSREPSGNVLTRTDLFNDPATALIKLRDDIVGLSGLIPGLETAVAPESKDE